MCAEIFGLCAEIVPNCGPHFLKKQFFTWATIRRTARKFRRTIWRTIRRTARKFRRTIRHTFGRTIRRTIWRTILRFWRSISAHDLGAQFGRTIRAHDSGAPFGRTIWRALRPSMRRFVLHGLGFFPSCSLPSEPSQPAPFPMPPKRLAHAQLLITLFANEDFKAFLGPLAWRGVLALAK